MQPEDYLTDDEEENDVPEPDVKLTDSGSLAFRLFDEFGQLTIQKRDKERELRAIKAAMLKLTPQLLTYFQQNNCRSVVVNNVNVHLRRELWAKPQESKERVAQALIACGLGKFVAPNYNESTLSKYVREIEREHWDDLYGEEATGQTLNDFLPGTLGVELNCDPTWKVRGSKPRQRH